MAMPATPDPPALTDRPTPPLTHTDDMVSESDDEMDITPPPDYNTHNPMHEFAIPMSRSNSPEY